MKGDVVFLADFSQTPLRFAGWFPASRGDHWWVIVATRGDSLGEWHSDPKMAFAIMTTFSNGCLGSHNDEERSEMRYVMRIARPRESLKL